MIIMPEIILRRVLQQGIDNLRANDNAFNFALGQYNSDFLVQDYGPTYIDKIRTWFKSTNIPVVLAWTFNPEKIPAISIHLAAETEDETKAAMGDYFGDDENSTYNQGVVTTNLDIGIHAGKDSDQVLWIYYIVFYILFKEKMLMDGAGLRLVTFQASEYKKDSQYMGNNIWSRWIRLRCTTENRVISGEKQVVKDIETDVSFERVVEEDVDPEKTDV